MVLLVASAGLLAGFELGRHAAHRDLGMDPEGYREARASLVRAGKQIQSLESELDVVRTRHAVDREALEMVRRDIAQQKEQLASLEEGIRFYRGLMAPGEIAEGLSFRQPELVAREEASSYGFRIVAQQEARKHDLLEGELSLEVFGEQDGEPVSYSLARLSDDIEDEVIALRFRYFQAIEGELTLPEGFIPGGIDIVATSSTPRKAEVSERFAWRIQERFSHVGK
jgi:hypothetical protein